jgi:predicted deacylase
MAKRFGIEYLVCSETPGSTFSAAARAGIPAILAESGGQGIWTPPDVDRLVDGVRRVMSALAMIGGDAPAPRPFTLLEQFLWLRSEHDAFWYPGVPVGAEVRKGQSLGTIVDAEGRVLQAALSPADGRVLFIVSSLAINRTDPLLAIGA